MGEVVLELELDFKNVRIKAITEVGSVAILELDATAVVAQDSAKTKLRRIILRVFIGIKISLSNFQQLFFWRNLVIYAFNSI